MANSKDVLFWSIALPGFGQFLNGNLIKGIDAGGGKEKYSYLPFVFSAIL